MLMIAICSVEELLVEAVEQGRCPADDFSDRVIENGIAATVTELALGEQ